MAYIFLDESGDLGFDFTKRKTTKFFVVTFLFTARKRPIEKDVRTVYSGLRKKYKMRDGMLHAAKEEPVTCTRLCNKLAAKNIKIMTIYLNKRKVFTKLQNEKPVLYNYVTNILIDRILAKRMVNKNEKIVLIASRRETNKFLNLNFQNYLQDQALTNHRMQIDIKIKTPFDEKGLQAVDMVSWAIFRRYEYGDDSKVSPLSRQSYGV